MGIYVPKADITPENYIFYTAHRFRESYSFNLETKKRNVKAGMDLAFKEWRGRVGCK